jgi:ribosomal protein L11 methyltransferase
MFHTKLTVVCSPEYTEILVAETSEIGFDTFLENENGFEAFVEETKYDHDALLEILNRYSQSTTLSYSFDKVEKRNWNDEWEKSSHPIIVDDKCLIRAHFHQIEKKYPYEITITPKMSFGTGHHQTTYLMIQTQMEIDHNGKIVMDAGCGTAVLSIMASKLGAKSVDAFDIDEWSTINGLENIDVNHCNNISIRKGKVSDLTFTDKFDIILANINKNILLEEMALYKAHLKPGGQLLLSGFFENDISDLKNAATPLGFTEHKRYGKENWASLLLQLSVAD